MFKSKIRKAAKDHSSMAQMYKPASSPGILAAIMRPPLTRGDTSPVGKPTQTDTRKK
jgi:hypothetical protein